MQLLFSCLFVFPSTGQYKHAHTPLLPNTPPDPRVIFVIGNFINGSKPKAKPRVAEVKANGFQFLSRTGDRTQTQASFDRTIW